MSIKPVLSYDDILRTPESYNVIPIIKEISGDMDTPVSIFSAFKKERYSFLFESTEGVGRWGRYSFICLNPALTFRLYKEVLSTDNLTGLDINYPENIKLDDIKQDIFSYIKTILLKFNIYKNNLIDGFIGGLFGYLGYEISGLIEKLPPDKKDVTDVYDLFFMLPRDVIVYDAIEQSIKIMSFIFKDVKNIETLKKEYESALSRLNSLSDKIQKRDAGQNESNGNDKLNFEIIDEIEYEQFKNKVLAAKEYILRGDIFQVQISRRKKIINPPAPFLFYRALRLVNPSPYMFYLKIDDFVITGSSPENLVKLEGDAIETRPIAGTIKRGENPEEDEYFAEKLLKDPKERAEHIMLVDLSRNDIGRVSEKGSVKIGNLMYIEKYSHVQHIVTSVVSKIKKGMDAFDLIKATYPAGTLTGAPKVRAMEIINELEESKRGIYGGGIGYFGFLEEGLCKRMEFCITIRTALFKKDSAYIQAAGGIVYDSTPENEFAETENKLKHLITALKMVERFS
ncbi:MAG: anthranilate synthase component I family protein [Deltaproteobacteria bacterium]|jgi:Anthranilate/para-aminobenzoate synthases component I|nr:anthranilate synthase component I family protein [Deltaproteobacteria bacterium]MCL6120055.1 anthranilate synthase component I family protein [Deltaproteobacteria bacterium]MDA8299901.1 anthranilate synthase component I family protein [Deltaproteobacteria bacterium]